MSLPPSPPAPPSPQTDDELDFAALYVFVAVLAIVGLAVLLCRLRWKALRKRERTAQPRPSAPAVVTIAIGEIPASDITLGRALGKGGQGFVTAGTWLGAAVAVKQVKARSFKGGDAGEGAERSKEQEMIMQEAAMLAGLRHPCVCQFFGTCLLDGGLTVVMELLSCTLHELACWKHAQPPGLPLSVPLTIRLAHETAQGIAYLHRNNVLHRDIKTCNVMVDELLHAKVCDFGLARAFTIRRVESRSPDAVDAPDANLHHTCGVGTLRYMVRRTAPAPSASAPPQSPPPPVPPSALGRHCPRRRCPGTRGDAGERAAGYHPVR